MRRHLAFGLFWALGVVPITANACSFPEYAASSITIHTEDLAERMFNAAATVDVAEAVAAEAWDPKAFFAKERAEAVSNTRPEWVADVEADYDSYEEMYQRFGASTVTYKIIERLKGPEADTFTLGGFYLRRGTQAYDEWGPDEGAPNRALPTGEDLYMRRVVDLADWGGSGSCAAPVVAVEGAHYLVFRNSVGQLLEGAVRVSSRKLGQRPLPKVDGPVLEPLGEKDAWLLAVRAAAADSSPAL